MNSKGSRAGRASVSAIVRAKVALPSRRTTTNAGEPSCAIGEDGAERSERHRESHHAAESAERGTAGAERHRGLAGRRSSPAGSRRCRPESGVSPHDQQRWSDQHDRHVPSELSRLVARPHRCVLPFLSRRADVERLLGQGEHHPGDRVQAGQHHGSTRWHRHSRCPVRHAADERRGMDRAGHADHASGSRSVGKAVGRTRRAG